MGGDLTRVIFTREEFERLRRASGLREGCTYAALVNVIVDRLAELAAVREERDLLKMTQEEGREIRAERDRFREALEVAAELLMGEGYDHDPDYTQEWGTISAALSPGKVEER